MSAARRNYTVPLVLLALLAVAALWWRGCGEGTEAESAATPPGATAARATGARTPRDKVNGRVPALPTGAWSKSGSISGRVTSTQGGPVAGADVCAQTSTEELGSAQIRLPNCTKSGPDGAYQLAGLYRVRFNVSAAAKGYLPAAFGEGDDAFKGVRLDREQGATGIDVVLAPGGVEVRGIIKDLSGGVVEGAFVNAQTRGNWRSSGPGAIALSNADGEFTLWVEAGEVSIQAQADGYASAWEQGRAPGMFITLILTPEAVLAGTVLDEQAKPVPGARVTAGGRWGRGYYGSAISDEAGRYRIDGLDAGRYKPEAEVAGASGNAKQSVRLGIGEVREDIDVFVYAAATVRATVVTDTGEPCEGGSFALNDAKSDARQYGEVRDGAADVKAVRPGHYTVAVRCEGFVPPDEIPDLDVGADDVSVQYTVQAGKTLRGVVVDAAGHGVDGASVAADTAEAGKASGPFSTWAQADRQSGAFELAGLAPGKYKVRVWAENSPTPKDPLEVDVPEVGEPEPLRIELAQGGNITGRVVDQAGAPIVGARVNAEGQQWGSAYVADDGTYTIEGLQAGEYRVQANGARWSDRLRKPGSSDDDVQGQSVTVVAGETVTVDLVVESRDGTISGVVVDEAGGPLADAYLSVTRQSDSATAAAGRAKQRGRWSWGVEPILSDVDGAFTATGLADGQYTVHAYRKGGGEGFVEDVAVGASGVQVKIMIEGSIAGTVKTEGGAPPERFSLTVLDAKAAFQRSEEFIRTDGGWAMHELPAGTFEVRVSSADGTAEQKDVALAAGADVTGIALTLEGRTTITGRVVTLGTNEPVAGVVVSASKGGGFSINFGEKLGKELTDSEGRYELENAPTGKLTLRVRPASFTDWDTMGSGSLLVVAEAGKNLDAPDIVLAPSRVPRGEQEGDLGFKINDVELGAEPGNHPKVVGFIRPGGPAADSGLKVGDVITKVDGHDITGAQVGLYSGLTNVVAGTTIAFTLQRGDTVQITAGPPV